MFIEREGELGVEEAETGMGNGMLVEYLFMNYRASVIFLTVNICGFDKTVKFTLIKKKKENSQVCLDDTEQPA